ILRPCGSIPPPAHREEPMKGIHWIVAAAALSFVQPASAATTDPEVIIYRFPNASDDGGLDFAGRATVFGCTNFSGATETIRFVTRASNVTLLTNLNFTMNHLTTLTASTHLTVFYGGASLATGSFAAGTTAIAATSTNIICTAVTMDASSSVQPKFV